MSLQLGQSTNQSFGTFFPATGSCRRGRRFLLQSKRSQNCNNQHETNLDGGNPKLKLVSKQTSSRPKEVAVVSATNLNVRAENHHDDFCQHREKQERGAPRGSTISLRVCATICRSSTPYGAASFSYPMSTCSLPAGSLVLVRSSPDPRSRFAPFS